MAKSRLDDRTLISTFHLLGREGMLFDSSEFKRKKNLVIFFLSDPQQDFLVKIEEAYGQMKEQNAEVAVVCPLSVAEIQNIHRRNRLTYWILCDETKEVFSRFIEAKKEEDVAALFITDKFADLFFQYVVNAISELPPLGDIVKSLVFIESQCPECGTGA